MIIRLSLAFLSLQLASASLFGFPNLSRRGRTGSRGSASTSAAPPLSLLPAGLMNLAKIRHSDKKPIVVESDNEEDIINALAEEVLQEAILEQPQQLFGGLFETPRSSQKPFDAPEAFVREPTPQSWSLDRNVYPREINQEEEEVEQRTLQNFGQKMAAELKRNPNVADGAPLPQLEYSDSAEPVMTAEDLERIESSRLGARQGIAADDGTEGTLDGDGGDGAAGEGTGEQQLEAQAGIQAPTGDDEVRCIPKVMQVEETVYDRAIKCHHSYQEKCHMTYITDYHSTTEKKCETTFKKNCHITFKPMPFNETVNVCHTPVVRACGSEAVGPEICSTHYETNCETRYKTYEIEQDEPVCKMEIMTKCEPVTLTLPPTEQTTPIPDTEAGAGRFKRQTGFEGLEDSADAGGAGGVEGAVAGDPNTITVDERCEEWPVQKCTLEKKTVKKVHPDTACRKIPREVCVPNNCEMKKGAEICRDESRMQVQNVPQEECELQPEETCHMEAVLVPRLVPKPNCVKVPKEICVNTKKNPRRVKKPIVKEWCYRPSDLAEEQAAQRIANHF